MTDDVVITVENLGKKYRIRHNQPESYVALRDVIAEKAKELFQMLKTEKLKSENDEEGKTLKTEKLKSGNSADISAFQNLSVSAFKNSASQNFSVSAFQRFIFRRLLGASRHKF